MCVFDIVANNADRKSGHVLLGDDGRLWGIDHGLCFHRQPKLRTVIWDFADEPVPGPLLDDLERLAADLPDELARLLATTSVRPCSTASPGWSTPPPSPSPWATDRPIPGPWSEPRPPTVGSPAAPAGRRPFTGRRTWPTAD